jgi:hypothetical protein
MKTQPPDSTLKLTSTRLDTELPEHRSASGQHNALTSPVLRTDTSPENSEHCSQVGTTVGKQKDKFLQSVNRPERETQKPSRGMQLRRALTADLSYGKSKKKYTPLDVTTEYQQFLQNEKKNETPLVHGNGLVEIQTVGVLPATDEAFSSLRALVPPENGVIAFDRITVTVLKELQKKDDDLPHLIARTLSSKEVYLYLKNDDGISTEISRKASTRMRMVVSGERVTTADGKALHKHKMVKTSGAVVLASLCLAKQEFDLFADIVAVAPLRILPAMTQIPLEGNIFTDTAVIAVLKRLVPASSKDVSIDAAVEHGAEGLSHILHHYFRFSPIKDLSAHLPKPLIKARKGAVQRDLLIQNHYKFAGEVGHLVTRVLNIQEREEGETSLIDQHIKLVTDDPLTKHEIGVIGSQAAHVIGNAFNYATSFSLQLKEDKAAVKAKVTTALEIFKAGIGTAATGTAASPGVSDYAKIGAGLLADMLTKWATSPDQELDIEHLSRELTLLSNSIAERAGAGCLVAGRAEWSKSEVDTFSKSVRPTEREVTHGRLNVEGKALKDSFKEHLYNFKQHYLETKLSNSAK